MSALAERIVVEETATGAYAVIVRPILHYCQYERAFPIAWDALEYADLLGDELGCGVLDRTGMC